MAVLAGRCRRASASPAPIPTVRWSLDPEVTWLEPVPDSVVWGGSADDPAAEVVDRESVRLAFVAALQHLTPPQRAILILRDVLAWQASEVADLLGMSTAAVNSSLQRQSPGAQTRPGKPRRALDDEHAKELLADYVAAFENYDVKRIVELLAEDAVWEMPPYLGWYEGSAAIGHLIETHCPAQGAGDQIMVPTSANGQPAFPLYEASGWDASCVPAPSVDADRQGRFPWAASSIPPCSPSSGSRQHWPCQDFYWSAEVRRPTWSR